MENKKDWELINDAIHQFMKDYNKPKTYGEARELFAHIPQDVLKEYMRNRNNG